MKLFLRIARLVTCLTSLALVLLTPHSLFYGFTANARTAFHIASHGVELNELRDLAQEHDVRLAQTRHLPQGGDDGKRVMVTSVELLEEGESLPSPQTSQFLSEDIVYRHAPPASEAIGQWQIDGEPTEVQAFFQAFKQRWPRVSPEVQSLNFSTIVAEARQQGLLATFLFSAVVLTLVIALGVCSDVQAYRWMRIAGQSPTRILLGIVYQNGLAALRWLAIPLGILGILIATERANVGPLSVHAVMLTLIIVSIAGGLMASLSGSFLGFLAIWGRIRKDRHTNVMGTRVLIGLLYCLTLTLVVTSSNANLRLSLELGMAQGERTAAQAQHHLPDAAALGIWSTSEATVHHRLGQFEGFLGDAMDNQRLFLVDAQPDGRNYDLSGPPTVYLNNLAATHFGLPTVEEGTVTIYRHTHLAAQDKDTQTYFEEAAAFRQETGAKIENPLVTIEDLDPYVETVPQDLPQLNPGLAERGATTVESFIAVVPDNYFSTDDYFSAVARGDATFLLQDRSIEELRQTLRAFDTEKFVGRIDMVGPDNASYWQATLRISVFVAILLATALAVCGATAMFTRALSQRRAQRRHIETMLGSRHGKEALLYSLLFLPLFLGAVWPLALMPTRELLISQCGLLLLIVAGWSFGLGRLPHWHAHKRTRREVSR